MEISYNAIHYIFLKACKSKASEEKKLTYAIRSFHKRFKGQDNLFLSPVDTSATVSELHRAYINYALTTGPLDKVSEKYTVDQALQCISQVRHIPMTELRRAYLRLNNY
jgi:hypothetical protein